MKDRTLVSNMRFQLHDMRDELVGVRMRVIPGARTDAIERAREYLQNAAAELETVLGGRLKFDDAPRQVRDRRVYVADGTGPERRIDPDLVRAEAANLSGDASK